MSRLWGFYPHNLLFDLIISNDLFNDKVSVSSSVGIKGSKICYMKLDIYNKSEKYIDGI